MIKAVAEELIPLEMLLTERTLVNGVVRVLNGYVNYLKRAGKDSAVHEDAADCVTENQNDTDKCRAADN